MAVEKTVRVDEGAARVKITNGESLLYKVTVRGINPLFTIRDSNLSTTLLSNNNKPDPAGSATWQTAWPNTDDSPKRLNKHVLGDAVSRGAKIHLGD